MGGEIMLDTVLGHFVWNLTFWKIDDIAYLRWS